MKAFITGISGFTGRHLAELLKGEGVQATGVDVNRGKYYQADLTDKKSLAEILLKEQPDYIFHLASPVVRSDRLVDEALVKNLEVDLFGSVNLIEAAAKLKKKPRILITGTAAEYDPEIKGKRKETDKLKPNTSYGLSKLTQELVCLKLAESYQIPLVYTRAILLIGPGQRLGFAVNDWCYQVAQGKKELITGNLDIKRDFMDIRDGVKAYWLLINKGGGGEVYNVCSGEAVALGQIIEMLRKIGGYGFKVKVDKPKLRENDVLNLVGNNSKLIKLGWKRKIGLKKSLQDIIDYWRKINS